MYMDSNKIKLGMKIIT